jgi:hypothetical protein
MNALAFDKSTHRMLHYNATHNATNWGTAKQIAYTDSTITGNAANVTGVVASANLDSDTMHLGVNQTVTNHKKFSDDKYITFGDGNDMRIYHDTSGAGPVNRINSAIALKIADQQSASVTIGKEESVVNNVGQNDATDVVIANKLTVNGNLVAKGEMIIETTTNLAIKDSVITVNDGSSGTPSEGDDIGIMFERGNAGNVFMGWDESIDKFIFVQTDTDAQAATGLPTNGLVYSTEGANMLTLLAGNFQAISGMTIAGNAVYPASTTTSLGTSNTVVPTQNAVKSYVDGLASNYATSAQGTLATNALPKAGGSMTGNLQMGANTLGFDQSGTRSWTMRAASGNFYLSSGDGNGAWSMNNNLSVAGELEATSLDINGAADISGAASIGSTLASNKYSVVTVQGRESHMFAFSGSTDHTLTLNSSSYFQAEVIITAHQTNGGAYNNIYIRGIWSNNHDSHHWDEIENIGGLTGGTIAITNGQNGSTAASGQLAIVHDDVQGNSFAGMSVNVIKHFGSLTHVIS